MNCLTCTISLKSVKKGVNTKFKILFTIIGLDTTAHRTTARPTDQWMRCENGTSGITLLPGTDTGTDTTTAWYLPVLCPDPNPDPHVLGLPDPDPLVRGMDPDPDPSIIKQK
jgi:hypothetical protein